MIIAFQDQTKVSPGYATTVVGTNIEIGNAAALAELRDAPAAGSA